MTVAWFRVDDTFAFHPKAVAAGNAACGLWVRAGAWSAQQLTDGFVPDHVVKTLEGEKAAGQLVKAGLWSKEQGGYRFHEWDAENRNWTREQVEARRKADRDRKAAAKARRQRRKGES